MARSWGLLLLLATCVVSGCKAPQEPPRKAGTLTAKIQHVRVADATFDGLTLHFDFEFANSSSVKVTVAEIGYALKAAGADVAKGKATPGTAIAPGAKGVATASVGLRFDELRKVAPGASEVPYALAATATVTPEGGKPITVPLAQNGVVQIVNRPAIELARLKLKELSVRNARLDLAFHVTNTNVFLTTIKEMKLSVELAGQRVGSVVLTPNTEIEPGKAAELVAPLPLDFLRLGDALYTAVARGDLDVKVSGDVRIMTPYGEPSFPVELARKMTVQR